MIPAESTSREVFATPEIMAAEIMATIQHAEYSQELIKEPNRSSFDLALVYERNLKGQDGIVSLEKPCEEEESSSKPSKGILTLCVIIFLATAVADAIFFDFAFHKTGNNIPFLIPLPYLCDALGRVLITTPLMNWRNMKNISFIGFLKIVVIRFGLAFGFCLGAKTIPYIGAGTKAMMQQIQILIVAGLRLIFFKENQNMSEILFAVAVTLGAVSFKIEESQASRKWGYFVGMIFMCCSCFIVSLFFVLTEKLLKIELKNFGGWDKQWLFAVVDVPLTVIMLAADGVYEYFVTGKELLITNMSIFSGLDDYSMWMIGINCVVFGLLLYFMFGWFDAMFVNILFVIGMAITWPIEVAIGYETFFINRLFILIFTVVCCFGYELEKRAKQKRQTQAKKNDQESEMGV